MEKNNVKKETQTLADLIKHEGIKAKGYGTIAKFLTHDRDLTIESKAIYGFMASLCGNGGVTFPSRGYILRCLNLSKKGYYEHYKALIKHGYITVSKADPSNVKSHNIYTLVTMPHKVEISLMQDSFNEKKAKGGSGINAFRSEKKSVSGSIDSYGYGILPKAVMMDERLDIKAKGIYCYFASYAGAGDTAFPEKKNILYHLKISEPTYYRYLNQLIQYNYIVPVQRKEDGRFGVCDYMLNQKPDEAIGTEIRQNRHNRTQSPNPKKEDISEPLNESAQTPQNDSSRQFPPNPKKEDIKKEDIKKEDIKKSPADISEPLNKSAQTPQNDSSRQFPPNPKKEDTSIINRSINRSSINISINQSQETASPLIDMIDNAVNNNSESEKTASPLVDNIEIISKDTVADNICLQELLNESPDKQELISLIYDILCETLSVKPKLPTVWINGRNTPYKEVFDAFSQINKKHIEYVVYSCYNNDNLMKARNPKAYVKFSLLRSTLTLENFDSRRFKKLENETLETRTQEEIEYENDLYAALIRNQKKLLA